MEHDSYWAFFNGPYPSFIYPFVTIPSFLGQGTPVGPAPHFNRRAGENLLQQMTHEWREPQATVAPRLGSRLKRDRTKDASFQRTSKFFESREFRIFFRQIKKSIQISEYTETKWRIQHQMLMIGMLMSCKNSSKKQMC